MIAILMATYNGELFLKEQIDSILNQSEKDFILYIRDDGSKDNTTKILNEYSKENNKIKIISDSLGNLGFVQNFFKLLETVDADYYAFSDQDDIWDFNKLKSLKDIMDKEENKNTPVLVHCDSYINGDRNKRFLGKAPCKEGLKNCFFKYMVQGSNMLINKELKEKVLNIKEKTKPIYFHDRFIHIIAEIYAKRYYINEGLMSYRIHESNTSGSFSFFSKVSNFFKTNKFYNEEDKKMFEKIYRVVEDENIKKIIEGYFYITKDDESKIKRMKYLIENKYYLSNLKKIAFFL